MWAEHPHLAREGNGLRMHTADRLRHRHREHLPHDGRQDHCKLACTKASAGYFIDGTGAEATATVNPAGKRVIVSTVILVTLGGLVVLASVFFCNNKNVVDTKTDSATVQP